MVIQGYTAIAALDSCLLSATLVPSQYSASPSTLPMASSSSEDEEIDDFGFDAHSEGDEDQDLEDDILGALEGDLAAAGAEEASEGDDVCPSLH